MSNVPYLTVTNGTPNEDPTIYGTLYPTDSSIGLTSSSNIQLLSGVGGKIQLFCPSSLSLDNFINEKMKTEQPTSATQVYGNQPKKTPVTTKKNRDQYLREFLNKEAAAMEEMRQKLPSTLALAYGPFFGENASGYYLTQVKGTAGQLLTADDGGNAVWMNASFTSADYDELKSEIASLRAEIEALKIKK